MNVLCLIDVEFCHVHADNVEIEKWSILNKEIDYAEDNRK